MNAHFSRHLRRSGTCVLWGLRVAVIGMCVVACGPITVATTETATVSVTCPAAPSNWTTHVTDSLQNANGGEWDIGPDPALAGSNRTFSAAGYHLVAPAHEGSIEGLPASPSYLFSDLIFQATVTIDSGTQNHDGGAGLVFRSDASSDDYFYFVRSTGDWSLEVFVNTGTNAQPTTLASGTSSYFRQGHGQANVLTVEAVGHAFTLCINGQRVAPEPKPDSTISMGSIGFEVDGGPAQGADAIFSDAHVWAP